MSAPVIIEAAINGGTPKSRNPNSPRSVEEIAADAVRCLDAGAAIVHNHNDDPVIGSERVMGGWHDPQPYVEAWRAVLDQRPEAILYPTMGSGGPGTEIAVRYSHIPALAAAGVLGQGLIDPGCVAMGGAGADGLPNDNDRVYINTYRDARHMFETCNRLGRGASISIFEPGFLRVVLAYHKRGLVPKGSLVKLYFGGDGGERNLSFGMLPNEACLDAYLSMLEGTGLPWSVAVLGGDVVGSGFARLALEKGGHVRVGLEDYAGPRQPTNVELLEELTSLCAEAGRPVASAGEALALLGLPPAPHGQTPQKPSVQAREFVEGFQFKPVRDNGGELIKPKPKQPISRWELARRFPVSAGQAQRILDEVRHEQGVLEVRDSSHLRRKYKVDTNGDSTADHTR